jgi:hypothetical protein
LIWTGGVNIPFVCFNDHGACKLELIVVLENAND